MKKNTLYETVSLKFWEAEYLAMCTLPLQNKVPYFQNHFQWGTQVVHIEIAIITER